VTERGEWQRRVGGAVGDTICGRCGGKRDLWGCSGQCEQWETWSVRGIDGQCKRWRSEGEARCDGRQDRWEAQQQWTMATDPKSAALKIRFLNRPKRELNDHCVGRFGFFPNSLTRFRTHESDRVNRVCIRVNRVYCKTSLLPSWLDKV